MKLKTWRTGYILSKNYAIFYLSASIIEDGGLKWWMLEYKMTYFNSKNSEDNWCCNYAKWSVTNSVQNLSLMSKRKTELYRLKVNYPVTHSLRTIWHHYDVIMADYCLTGLAMQNVCGVSCGFRFRPILGLTLGFKQWISENLPAN